MKKSTKHRLRDGIAAAGLVLFGISLAVPAAAQLPVPKLLGDISRNVGKIAGRDRSFLVYVPQDLKPGAALLLVFHGAGQEGKDVRISMGYEFDVLADTQGFIVAYPDGIDSGWSGCRKTSLGRRQRQTGPDDMAFVQAIIAHQAAVHAIDKKRVFAVGYSNGGAIAYRLALEYPDNFAGIAIVASGFPTQSDMGCKPKNTPIPLMIVNGTADPLNPYRGGRSRTAGGDDPIAGNVGFSNSAGGKIGDDMGSTSRGVSISPTSAGRGPVMATEATAQYWAKLNGQSGPPERTKLPHVNASDPTSVEAMSWTEPGKPPVVLYSVINGGHVVPTPYFRYPRIVGRQTDDMDAPVAMWDFFSKLPSRP